MVVEQFKDIQPMGSLSTRAFEIYSQIKAASELKKTIAIGSFLAAFYIFVRWTK